MYLQLNTDETRDIYKDKINRPKGLVKQVHDESWSKLIGRIERDVHRRQLVAYKMLK